MQHIAFDIGNVLVHVDFNKFYNVMQSHGFTENEISEFIDDLEYGCNMGMLTLAQALRVRFPQTFANGQMNKHWEEIKTAWNDSIKENDIMMNFVSNLKNEGVKVALLSNIGLDHAKFLRSNCSEVFNTCIQHFSFEVGAAKPQVLYYQSFLLNNEDFAGCVYLDDRKENIVAAAKQKFDAVHFDLDHLKKPSDIKKALYKIKERIQKGW
jgi:FMN phosphatase YigB (HAD superfamily)